jgi:hypothetical protein
VRIAVSGLARTREMTGIGRTTLQSLGAMLARGGEYE